MVVVVLGVGHDVRAPLLASWTSEPEPSLDTVAMGLVVLRTVVQEIGLVADHHPSRPMVGRTVIRCGWER